jgi:hypothetical protein
MMNLCQAGLGGSQYGFMFGPFPDGSLIRSITVVSYEDIEAEVIGDGAAIGVDVAAAFMQHRPNNTAGDCLIAIVNSQHKVINGHPLFSTADASTTPPQARLPQTLFSSAAATDAATRAVPGPPTVIPVNAIVAGGHQWLVVTAVPGTQLGPSYVMVAVDAVPPARRNKDLGWPLA